MTYTEAREKIRTWAIAHGGENLSIKDVDLVIQGLSNVVMSSLKDEKEINIYSFFKISEVYKKEQSGTAFAGTPKEAKWVKPAHFTLKMTISDSFRRAYEKSRNPEVFQD